MLLRPVRAEYAVLARDVGRGGCWCEDVVGSADGGVDSRMRFGLRYADGAAVEGVADDPPVLFVYARLANVCSLSTLSGSLALRLPSLLLISLAWPRPMPSELAMGVGGVTLTSKLGRSTLSTRVRDRVAGVLVSGEPVCVLERKRLACSRRPSTLRSPPPKKTTSGVRCCMGPCADEDSGEGGTTDARSSSRISRKRDEPREAVECAGDGGRGASDWPSVVVVAVAVGGRGRRLLTAVDGRDGIVSIAAAVLDGDDGDDGSDGGRTA